MRKYKYLLTRKQCIKIALGDEFLQVVQSCPYITSILTIKHLLKAKSSATGTERMFTSVT